MRRLRSHRGKPWWLLLVVGLVFGSFEVHAASHEHLRRSIREAWEAHPHPDGAHIELSFHPTGPRCPACLNNLRNPGQLPVLSPDLGRTGVRGWLGPVVDTVPATGRYRLPASRGPPLL